MRQVMVIDVVGLTRRMLGPRTPHLRRIADRGFGATMGSVLPAVTCPAQVTMTTGCLPREHGIVGNGWYFRDLGEVWLWRQSNRLVEAEQVWTAAQALDPEFTCAHLFWWYCMGVACQWSVTPRPVYHIDGRKSPDVYARPPELKQTLVDRLGTFPLFRFWGPAAGIASSQWIKGAAEHIFTEQRPTLTMVYLPHLDYDLQRHGPNWEGLGDQLAAVDGLVGELDRMMQAAGGEVLVVSGYGIQPVAREVHVNRALREAGLLEVTTNAAGELLDPLTSRAFAVADHQVAHVYVRDPEDQPKVESLLLALDGVGEVLGAEGKRREGLDHPRSGELIAVAAAGWWFTYYYWLDERSAPDFAGCVEIHRKPGYDPAELHLNPDLALGKLTVPLKLLKKKLGFRSVMNVVPTSGELVRGSHGRRAEDPEDGPLFLSSVSLDQADHVAITSVKERILATLSG